MRTLKCDVAVIGAGSAGLSARSAAVAVGAHTVLIEQGPGGTTCARVGCMPSKLLIAASQAADSVHKAPHFGVSVAGYRVEGREVMARVRRERDRFVASVMESVERIPANGKLSGTAQFESATRLQIDDHTVVDARSIVIATGSRSTIPDVLSSVKRGVLTNESIFELDTLPRSLAVLGAGPLGLELAQAMARLGVRVALFDLGDRIAGLRDPAVLDVARKIFGEQLDLRLKVQLDHAHEVADGVELTWRDAGGEPHSEVFEYVLAAAGRAPNLQLLALERSGLQLDSHGTPVFDRATLQCGTQPVFIAGDANHERAVLHEASAEGRIAGTNAATFPDVKAHARMTPLAIVFSDPNVAAIGLSFEQAQRQGAQVGHASYDDQGRAKVFLQNAGLIHLWGDDKGRLIGGEMVGPAVEHSAHLLAWCIQQKLSAREVLAMPFYHPSFEEGLRTALRELCGKTGTLGTSEQDVMTYGPAP